MKFTTSKLRFFFQHEMQSGFFFQPVLLFRPVHFFGSPTFSTLYYYSALFSYLEPESTALLLGPEQLPLLLATIDCLPQQIMAMVTWQHEKHYISAFPTCSNDVSSIIIIRHLEQGCYIFLHLPRGGDSLTMKIQKYNI